MTYPSDPQQPSQYQPEPYQPEQSAWAQSQPPQTGGFQPTQYQPAYGSPYDPAAPGPMSQGPQGPGGPVAPKRGKGLIALIAALAVAVVGLGVGLIISLNRSGTTATGSTSTVTVTAAGSGEATVTVTETVEGGGGGGGGGGEPGPAPSSGRVEGVVGEPAEVQYTDYDDTTSVFTVTVHTAEWKDQLEGEYVDPPTETFLVLDVTIEVSEGLVDYSSSDWTVKDAEGREYRDAYPFGSDLALMGVGSVAPGEKVRGYLVFDLPRGEATVVYSRAFDDLGVSYQIPA